jgi:HlyD family secretion protein
VKKVLIGAGVAIVLAGVVFLSMRPRGAGGTPVYVAKVEAKDLEATVRATGVIAPAVKVNVSAEVAGRITELPVREGEAVRKGQLLVDLDAGPLAREVEALEASLRMAEIAVREQQVALRDAEATLARRRELHASGLVSREELDRAEVAAESARVRLEQIREQVTQARAGVEKGRDELAKTRLVSPMDGVVTELRAEKGESVVAGLMNTPGTVILVVSDMSRITGEFQVDEHDVASVKVGQPAKVTVEALEGKTLGGEVTEIRQTAIKQLASDVPTFTVKVALEDGHDALRPGMTARAVIETERRPNALSVPIQAVLTGEAGKDDEADATGSGAASAKGEAARAEGAPAVGTPAEGAKGEEAAREWVFVVDGGKARKRVVATGISDERRVELTSGVKAGEQVVTGPYRKLKDLKDGDAVKPEEEGKAKGKDKDRDRDDDDEKKG